MPVQLGRAVQVDHQAVDAGPVETRLADRLEDLLVLPLAPANHGSQEHQAGSLGHGQEAIEDLLGRLLADRGAALVTARLAQPGIEQPQVVVDLRHRGDRAAGIAGPRPLVDRNGRLEPLDQVHVGPLELMEELAGVEREAFDVLPLALGIEGVEGQGALPRPTGTGNHHQPVARDVQVDVAEVMDAGPADADLLAILGLDLPAAAVHRLPKRGV